MSENKISQTADETTEAQLTDGQLEEVAGGVSVVDTIIDGVNSAIETVTRAFT